MKSSTIICAIAIISLALFVGKTTISLYPFKISIERPFYTVGHLLIIIGVVCFMIQDYKSKSHETKTAIDLQTAQDSFTKHNRNDGFIQWKGTDVCMDFYCDCGWHNHYDGYFAYEVECGQCGEVFAPSSSVEMIKLENHSEKPLQDREA